MDRKILFAAAGTAAALFGLLCGLKPLDAAEGAADSQTFSPARYALTAAEINAASQQPGFNGPCTRKIALKIDTRTGQVWVLQLSVAGENDPTVLNAVWAPVQTGTAFSVNPSGNQ